MKARLSMAVLLSGLTCMSSFAQSSLTVYGTVSAALRTSTNVDPTGKSRLELTGSNLGAGWWGLRGTEDLGGGMQARFKLESGFSADTGQLRNGGLLFGREASVGLGGSFGQFDMGRLQVVGNVSEVLVRTDPARGGGQFETVWPGVWTGDRYDNALRYRYDIGPVFLGAQVTLGEQAREAGAGRTTIGTAGYHAGPVYLIGAYQVLRDGNMLHGTTGSIGGIYTFSSWSLHGAYMHATRDKNFLIAPAAGAALFNTGLGFAGIKAPADVMTNFYLLGATATLAPGWTLRGTGFYSTGNGATLLSASRGGQQRTLYGVLTYDFSKRTALVASVDFNRWTGGWGGYWGASAASLAAYKPDGRDTRRTASLGLLHAF